MELLRPVPSSARSDGALVRWKRSTATRGGYRIERRFAGRDDRDAAVTRHAFGTARDDHRSRWCRSRADHRTRRQRSRSDRMGSCANGSPRASSRSAKYCSWAAGLYSNIPKLFGLRAEVEKVACVCDGAPVCEYHIQWFPDDATAVADNFEARIQMMTARLEGLQQIVGDLVSDDDLEDVLQRIVVSAARTMSAPIFVLALEAMPSADKHVYALRRRRRRGRAPCNRAARRTRRRRREPSCRRSAIQSAALRKARRRSTPAGGSSPRSASYSRPTPAWWRPRSIPRLRSRKLASRRSRPAPCSSSRTRSRKSPPARKWPRTSPAP